MRPCSLIARLALSASFGDDCLTHRHKFVALQNPRIIDAALAKTPPGMGQSFEKCDLTKAIAILQSAYIPWRGYFDIIRRVQEFVIYDDVQFSKNHWHNRNQIKTQHGLKWLTIPVPGTANSQPIDAVPISAAFADKHWRSISQTYARSPHYATVAPFLAELYAKAEALNRLSDVNQLFLSSIAQNLGLSTRFVNVRDLKPSGSRTERLISICLELGAQRYISGPSARSYLDPSLFARAGVDVEWMDYGHYPPYPQLYGAFEPAASIVDLLMNTGADASRYLVPQA